MNSSVVNHTPQLVKDALAHGMTVDEYVSAAIAEKRRNTHVQETVELARADSLSRVYWRALRAAGDAHDECGCEHCSHVDDLIHEVLNGEDDR